MVTNSIRVLDPGTIDQICAGQVVSRPLSIAKELIENAIDAGSDAITLDFVQGGIGSLSVSDNGCGIHKSDAPLVFEAYATSKIRQVDDLFSLRSLGFRGEALRAIASVSRVELTTRAIDSESGFSLVARNGKLEAEAPAIHALGTTVRVSQLFHTVPARKRFIASPAKEVRKLLDYALPIAAHYDGVAFTVSESGRILHQSDKIGHESEKLSKIARLYSLDRVHDCEASDETRSFRAYFLTPGEKKVHYRSTFVNQRLVESPLVHKAIKDAFSDAHIRTSPYYAIDIRLDVKEVNVNIHPDKTEVSFAHPVALSKLVYQGVRAWLNTLPSEASLRQNLYDALYHVRNDRDPVKLGRVLYTEKGHTVTSCQGQHYEVHRKKAEVFCRAFSLAQKAPVSRKLKESHPIAIGREHLDFLHQSDFIKRLGFALNAKKDALVRVPSGMREKVSYNALLRRLILLEKRTDLSQESTLEHQCLEIARCSDASLSDTKDPKALIKRLEGTRASLDTLEAHGVIKCL